MKHTPFCMLLTALALILGACSSDNEEYKSKIDQDDDNTTQTIDESYTYRLPVIFHVLYSADNEAEIKQKVTPARLAEILDHVNKIYSAGYYSTDIGTGLNINLRFEMATHNESDQQLSTPGVEYIKWSGTYPIDHAEFMNSDNKGYARYLWEPNDFINVMVYPFAPESGSEVTLGVSHLPFTLKDVNETDGLTALESKYTNITKKNLSFAYCTSINSNYIDYELDRYTNTSHNIEHGTLNQSKFDINVTLAHELGHYLGLLHAFTEETDEDGNTITDACADTDYCTDTQTYNRPNYLRRISEIFTNSTGQTVSFRALAERTDCQGNTFVSTNIMDYSYNYAYEFTAQQKARIRRVLYNSPLIPGPKQRLRTQSRTGIAEPEFTGVANLPIRVVK